jgi:magnesium-transporting ATPase (P-type)
MQQVLNQVSQMAQKLVSVIWQVLQFIWNWSFGQIVKMVQMPFNNLPLWKQVLFVLVIGALAYFFYKIAKDLLKAVQSVLGAIVGLVSALIAMLPQDRLGRAYRVWWRMGPD